MGRSYASGEEWKDPDNPCRVFTCKAGVITESEEKCYVPCSQWLPPEPGQCCRTCPSKSCCRRSPQLNSSTDLTRVFTVCFWCSQRAR